MQFSFKLHNGKHIIKDTDKVTLAFHSEEDARRWHSAFQAVIGDLPGKSGFEVTILTCSFNCYSSRGRASSNVLLVVTCDRGMIHEEVTCSQMWFLPCQLSYFHVPRGMCWGAVKKRVPNPTRHTNSAATAAATHLSNHSIGGLGPRVGAVSRSHHADSRHVCSPLLLG